ncbi:SHD1 domain-containing protein [Pontiellaceae bacterium B1224]|nr:SHD1 domain-containing protein [Pontiellaceae bacterium B1224]
MKFIFVMCLALVGTVFGENHTFTLKDGRTLEAEIMGVSAGKVSLKRSDGKTIPVPANVFVEADVAYIKQWAMFEGVRSTSKFKLSIERKKVKSWDQERLGTISYTDGSSEEDQVVGKTDYDEVAFEIVLNNRNKYALSDLILEYNIYYEQMSNSQEKEPGQYVLSGSIKLDTIGAQSKQELLTKTVTVYKDESDSSFLNAQVLKGDVHGIVCRICTMQDKKKVVLRSDGLPEKLSETKAWASESKLSVLPKFRTKD